MNPASISLISSTTSALDRQRRRGESRHFVELLGDSAGETVRPIEHNGVGRAEL
jgi:hypothetical protein